jgi:hypothetical protein
MFTKAALTLTALTLATASFAMSDADANADKMLSMDEMKGIRPVKARFQAFSGCQCHGMSSSMRLIL